MPDTSDAAPLPQWEPPTVDLAQVTTGDMPGDQIKIGDSHIAKANTIFPHLLKALRAQNGTPFVVSVYGGSGVGKSEIASLLGHFSKRSGFNAYVMSGDNYALRVPHDNDFERHWRFRTGGLRAFSRDANFTEDKMDALQAMWPDMADMVLESEAGPHPDWMSVYQQAGLEALAGYLGTVNEIDFPTVNAIIDDFKNRRSPIRLKRMGQEIQDLRYGEVDFSDVQVLIVEWTHGNNANLEGVDFPVFLFSTPAETLAHRLARGRDKNTDTPLISRVLELEQNLLMSQADRAALIISKDGDVLSQAEFQARASESEGK